MAEMALTSVGDQQLTVSSAAIRLTLPSAGGRELTPRHCCIYVSGGTGIRWLGGNAAGPGVQVNTTPTATVGMLVAAGGYIQWMDPQADYRNLIKNAQFIRVSTDATLDIIYFT